jgi:hypothetical protein
LAFFTQNTAKLFKNLIITIVFEKSANFYAENCQKSKKIVIITSTPDFAKYWEIDFFGQLWNVTEVAPNFLTIFIQH